MAGGGVKFGTSGLRGPAAALEGQVARRYVAAFLRHAGLAGGSRVFLGRDFRVSSPAIMRDCAAAIGAAGLEPVDCGTLPTPALALHAMAAGGAAIMVTGSHIPGDRNGLKFYLASGEISKANEAGIVAALRDEVVPDFAGEMADEAAAAEARYVARFASLLPEGVLAGWRIGVFEHSSVARDLLGLILRGFGAEVVSLGRSADFVPVDTEAFGDAVFAPLPGWVADYGLDAIVSADGDGDRPLLMDGRGGFVRGDVLGLITARYLGAQSVVTPVTSNSGIERTGAFSRVVRTRVGSPYVIEAMAGAPGAAIGFEANGGTFVGENVKAAGVALPPLVTRDAVLPLLCALGLAAAKGRSVAEVVVELPLQHALAGRLQDVPGEKSAAFLARLAGDTDYARRLFVPHGIAGLSDIDGLQFRTEAGDMVHFRASGNAPELRCYVEAGTEAGARELLDWGLAVAAREVG
ncbi:phosphomannomutase [Devosia ginsengisoli]|uniref:phosphomannomutase n=1 Tax=Devosia ginsengisoli TaxID=400770 RepID=UPI0026F0BDB9|nr:phosphomannomutase [Devosia ginsengisoli]MCR6673622.1 phosphomannomutase [Devosia ginsengisoli]